MNTPPHAAVFNSVETTKILKKKWSSALVNKVLRRLISEKDKVLKIVQQSESAVYAHPDWLIEKIKLAWPEDWSTILTANNHQAPLTLRVNPHKISRDAYLDLLKQQAINAFPIEHLPQAIQLEKPLPVEKLPEFFNGFCSVQDVTGQMIAPALHLQKGQRLLDACAAPGSKTCQIIEMEPELAHITAIDIDAIRLKKIKDNIDRLELPRKNVQLVLADASHTNQWWDGTPFDRILLDAPCSGTGVIRRHPDIKHLRRLEDLQAQVQMQTRLLNTLWPLLRAQGLMVYSTCSILPEENQERIRHFLQEHKNAKLKEEKQFFPQTNGGDGFFYAIIQKKSS